MMNFLHSIQRINQRCDESVDEEVLSKVDPKLQSTALLEDSIRTADADVSDRSYLPELRTSSSAIDSDGADRPLRGCLKVKTQQRASLAMISQPTTITSHEPAVDTPDKVIRFGTTEFRQYEPVLVDSPSTSSGPPIGLDWRYDPADTLRFDLDFYESEREGFRRNKHELLMPPSERAGALAAAGHSPKEMRAAERRSHKDKGRIRTSMKLQSLEPILERVESVKIGVKRAFK